MGRGNGRKSDEKTALAGIEVLENFILEIGLPVTLRELGVQEENAHNAEAAMQYIYNGLIWLWKDIQ